MCTCMWSWRSEEEVGVLCYHSPPFYLFPLRFNLSLNLRRGWHPGSPRDPLVSAPCVPQCRVHSCMWPCFRWVLGSQFFIQVSMPAQQILLLPEPSPECQTTPLESFTTTDNGKLGTEPLTRAFGAIQDVDYGA